MNRDKMRAMQTGYLLTYLLFFAELESILIQQSD